MSNTRQAIPESLQRRVLFWWLRLLGSGGSSSGGGGIVSFHNICSPAMAATPDVAIVTNKQTNKHKHTQEGEEKTLENATPAKARNRDAPS